MRPYALVATAALLTANLAAHADTIVTNLSVAPNTVSTSNFSGFYGADTNFFAQFNPALGTLNSVTLSLTGTATATSQEDDSFNLITPASNPQNGSRLSASLLLRIPSRSPEAGKCRIITTLAPSKAPERRLFCST